VSSQYPKDEFDRAGEDMPVGMHRPQPSRWRSVLPFLVILVVVPLLGWGASHLLTSQGLGGAQSDTSAPTSQPAQSSQSSGGQSSSEASPSGTPEPSESATPEETTPTPTPTPTQSVDYNVVISVLNGTTVQGYAAEAAAQLNNAGFPGTSAANAGDWASQSSVVYYSDPDLEATANEVARVLGVGAVSTADDADLGGADIIVLLR
jgi:hypothetical protein